MIGTIKTETSTGSMISCAPPRQQLLTIQKLDCMMFCAMERQHIFTAVAGEVVPGSKPSVSLSNHHLFRGFSLKQLLLPDNGVHVTLFYSSSLWCIQFNGLSHPSTSMLS